MLSSAWSLKWVSAWQGTNPRLIFKTIGDIMNLFKAINLLIIDKLTNKKVYLTWNEWNIFENKYPLIYKKIMGDV